MRRRLTRKQFSRLLAERAPSLVVMEACGTAHHWARCAKQHGHEVRLLPPHAVRPYVLRNKTDRADAKGLLEAHRNQDIRSVPVKHVDQHTITSLHRVRSGWVATRTARLNTLRGLLRELGVSIPVGARNVVPAVRRLVADGKDDDVPAALHPTLEAIACEITTLEERIREVERSLEALARSSAEIRRLRTVPGIGLLTATALFASLGDLRRFPSGRHLASALGLTPREHSSGLTRRLGRITKRGDPYLRMLLVHGARSLLHHAKRTERPDVLRAWARGREASIGHNKAAVAVANKLARIVWSVSVHERDYASRPAKTTPPATQPARAQ